MEQQLQIFENQEFGKIRTAGTKDNPVFCLADLCKALELDASQVMKRLDDGVVTIHPIIDSLGRTQKANFVNEDGMYDVILDSRKPEAKRFRKWITSEVLLSIRKSGSYSVTQTVGLIVYPAVQDIGAVAETLEKIFGVNRPMALSKAIASAEKAHSLDLSDIKELLPPAEYETGSLTASKIAEIVGLSSARAVNKVLVELGLITKNPSGKGYDLTEEGKTFGEILPYTATNGHSGYRVM